MSDEEKTQKAEEILAILNAINYKDANDILFLTINLAKEKAIIKK